MLQQKGSQLLFKRFVLVEFFCVIRHVVVQSNSHIHYTCHVKIHITQLNMEIQFFFFFAYYSYEFVHFAPGFLCTFFYNTLFKLCIYKLLAGY
jgi:hypothetical protein